jgi:hypothetical protein
MTLKRLFLVFLTILASVLVFADLLTSWNQPQFQNQLELSQTDLLLQASQYQGDLNTRQALIDKDPEATALKAYQKTRQAVETAIKTAEAKPSASNAATAILAQEVEKQEILRSALDLRIGLLQAHQGKTSEAIQSWKTIETNAFPKTAVATADVLTSLWQNTVPMGAEPTLRKNLNGWFRYRSLEKLYTLQQRSDALNQLRENEQQTAQQALIKLATINAVPAIAVILGLGVLIFLIGQRLIKGKQAVLAGTDEITWNVPWDGEIIWQVLIVGFFFVGQFLIGQVLRPIMLGISKSVFEVDLASLGVRGIAFMALATYIALAAGALAVLYWSIKSFLPLPSNWFRFSLKGNWLWWGLGGYVAAYPLVVGVSWLNEQIWQGRGGSNPLLPIALEGRDPVAIGVFLLTAAIAAPLFEETFFRGFLLPSLTKYFSTWQAILLSSVLFAVVHLSLSEVIPLTTLGIVLAFVYTRTQNLMASVLLHALWNSGTLLTLFLLGSAAAS